MVVSAKLVASLLVAIAGYTGYAIPGVPPRIRSLSHVDLAEQVCGRPCGVIGFTTSQGDILLDDSLMVGIDPTATSILVHELTHFLQIRSAVGRVKLDCRAWLEREREAYAVQFRWLHDQAPNIRTFSVEMVRLGPNPILPECPSDGHAANGAAFGLGGQ